jgi:hypothetical protein
VKEKESKRDKEIRRENDRVCWREIRMSKERKK